MCPSPPAAVTAGLVLVVAAFTGFAKAWAEEDTLIGTMHAALNGEARTWYVQAGGDVPGATWMKQGPGRYSAVITGFESRDREVEGSQLTVTFRFATGETKGEYPVSSSDRGPAAVRLMPSVKDIEKLHTVEDGVVIVDRIEPGDRGRYRFSGRFNGTLSDGADGEVVGELTSGTFEINGALQSEAP